MAQTCTGLLLHLENTLNSDEWLKKTKSLSRENVNSLMLDLRFLGMLLEYIPTLSPAVDDDHEDDSLKSVLKNIEANLEDAVAVYKSSDSHDDTIFQLKQQIELLRPQIMEAYATWANIPLDKFLSPLNLEGFIISLLKTLKLLLMRKERDHMKEQVESLMKILMSIRHFILRVKDSPAVHQNPKYKNLYAYLCVMAISSASLACSCWIKEIDKSSAEGMNTMLAELQQKFKPNTPQLMEMYLGVLKAYKSSESVSIVEFQDVVGYFCSFLLANLMDSNPIMKSEKIIHKALKVLITNLIDASVDYAGDDELLILKVASLNNSSLDKQITKDILKSFEKISLIPAELFLMDQQNESKMVEETALTRVSILDDLAQRLKIILNDNFGPDEEKTNVHTVRMELTFLRMLLCNFSKWSDAGKGNSLRSSIMDIEASLEDALKDYYEAYGVPDIDEGIKILAKIDLKPKIKEAFINLSCSCPLDDYGLLEEFIDSLLETMQRFSSLGYSTSHFYVADLNKVLKSVKSFIGVLTKKPAAQLDHPKFKDLLAHLSIATISAAMLTCSLFINGYFNEEEDENMAQEMKVWLVKLHKFFKPNTAEVMEIYIGGLKALKLSGSASSTSIQDVMNCFQDFLFESLMMIFHFNSDIYIDEYLFNLLYDLHQFLLMELISFITYIIDAPEEHTEDLELILKDMKLVIWEVCSLNLSVALSPYIKMEELVKFHDKVKLIKAEIFFMDQQNLRAAFTVLAKDQILQEGFTILTSFLKDTQEDITRNGQQVFLQIEAVARELGLHYCSFQCNEIARHMVKKMSFSLVMLLDKIVLLKARTYFAKLFDIDADSLVHVKERVKDLQDSLMYLSPFPVDESEINQENQKQLLSHIEKASKAGALYDFFHPNEMTENIIKETGFTLLKILEEVVLYKTQLVLMEELKNNASCLIQSKDLCQSIHEGLLYLRRLIEEVPGEIIEDWELILTYMVPVVRAAGDFYFSFQDNEIVRVKDRDMELLLNHLLEKIQYIHKELKEINLEARRSSRSNFPQTGGLGFIDLLLGNLREILKNKADSVSSVKHQIEAAQGGLESLRYIFMDITKQDNEYPVIEDFHKRITDVAYELEYVIDSFVLKDGSITYATLCLSYIIEEIDLIKTGAMETFKKTLNKIEVHHDSHASKEVKSHANVTRNDESVVVLKDQSEVIINRLTRGSIELAIVSIYGMPGLGKTTLAEKVFEDSSVVYHFNVRAWCSVSQVYQRKDLLLEILGNIMKITDKIEEMSDEDLAHELYKQLSGKRYLIVMDDVWNVKAWNDLQASFPRNGNGSRILITSRLRDVALQANPNASPHLLRSLSDEESWKLLQAKVKLCQEEGFPHELMDVAKNIAQNCKGLPLALVVVAGLLKKLDRTEECWEQVAKNLTSHIVDDPESNCSNILLLSYNHLPDHLKPCFLYFGAFQKGKEIPVRKLVQLWIAEGFIWNTEQNFEDIAEGYLEDLIGRSLVIFSRKRSKGGTKSCRIHDMLRELCLRKSKEENFLQIILGYDGLLTSNSQDCGSSIKYDQRRLCIYSERENFVTLRPSGPSVRSLLFIDKSGRDAKHSYDLSFICQNFRLLRVLDSESINIGGSFPDGISMLLHLRYLAVKGDMNFIPSSIARLCNLETMLVKGLRGEIVLPDTIWSMARLRHIHVINRAAFSLEDYNEECSSQLLSLITLSSPSLSSGQEHVLRRLPKLRKLRCIFLDSWDSSGNYNQFPVLNFLTELESLKIFYHGGLRHSCDFHFPLNLKKLTLSKFCLPWNCISAIASLPNLEVLKLLFKAFEGEKWDMGEEEFPALKFLKLDNLNIVQWDALGDHFPCLERLVLRSCDKLKEVPSSFGEMPTLQMIEVQWCNQDVVESVRAIQELQLENSNEEFKVLID